MNKPNLSKWTKMIGVKAAKHSPEILTGIGIAGMVTSTVLAVKATPKALVLLEEATDEKHEDLTVVETVKVAWKPYIPAAVTGAVSIGCLIGASSVNARRNAALATAYKLSETALTEYREKVTEVVGEKKEKEIRKEIAKDKLEQNPIQSNQVIITDRGKTLCLDSIGGRQFTTEIDRIKRAENVINRKLLNNMYVSLNEFYDELGLEHTKLGNDLGWKMEDGYVTIEYYPQLTEKDEPCLVLDYSVAPRYDYFKFV